MIGCGSEGSASAGATVRDSAGIRIVENAEPAWPEEGGWSLSAEPVLSIGILEGDPNYLLYRVVDAVRLDDGRIVVGNGGTHEIRAYAPDGRFLWSTGREGDGPGEFRNLGWLERLAPDSLASYDWGNRRVSIFDERGEFARSFLLELPDQAGFPNPVGMFADGSILPWAGTGFGDIGGVRTGVQSEPVTYYRFDRTGTLVDTVGTFPGAEYFLQTRGQGYTVTSLVFGRAPRVATSGDRFYFGSTEFGPDWVLGRARNELDVESIRIYRLIKG